MDFIKQYVIRKSRISALSWYLIMCKLVVRSGFYEELSVPTPHLRNAHFFITRLYKIGQKPKFRQCYFLGNIKNIKIYILGTFLVPVSEDLGRPQVPPVAARLYLFCRLLKHHILTLKVLNFWTFTSTWSGWNFDSYCSLKPLCSGIGEVVPARTLPTLPPPSPRTVL